MCGRYKLSGTSTDIYNEFHIVSGGQPNLPARYNVAPTDRMPIVRMAADGRRELAIAKWGLVPSWAKEEKIAFSTINARAETVREKPAFRDALKQRRCLVVADGWYEWTEVEKKKQPHLFEMAGGRLMAFAGLWERWLPKDKDAAPLESFTIVVCSGNDFTGRIHDRMPVILPKETHEAWLSPSTPVDKVMPWLAPSSEEITVRDVSRRMNKVGVDDPSVLIPP